MGVSRRGLPPSGGVYHRRRLVAVRRLRSRQRRRRNQRRRSGQVRQAGENQNAHDQWFSDYRRRAQNPLGHEALGASTAVTLPGVGNFRSGRLGPARIVGSLDVDETIAGPALAQIAKLSLPEELAFNIDVITTDAIEPAICESLAQMPHLEKLQVRFKNSNPSPSTRALGAAFARVPADCRVWHPSS